MNLPLSLGLDFQSFVVQDSLEEDPHNVGRLIGWRLSFVWADWSSTQVFKWEQTAGWTIGWLQPSEDTEPVKAMCWVRLQKLINLKNDIMFDAPPLPHTWAVGTWAQSK